MLHRLDDYVTLFEDSIAVAARALTPSSEANSGSINKGPTQASARRLICDNMKAQTLFDMKDQEKSVSQRELALKRAEESGYQNVAQVCLDVLGNRFGGGGGGDIREQDLPLAHLLLARMRQVAQESVMEKVLWAGFGKARN